MRADNFVILCGKRAFRHFSLLLGKMVKKNFQIGCVTHQTKCVKIHVTKFKMNINLLFFETPKGLKTSKKSACKVFLFSNHKN